MYPLCDRVGTLARGDIPFRQTTRDGRPTSGTKWWQRDFIRINGALLANLEKCCLDTIVDLRGSRTKQTLKVDPDKMGFVTV